VKHAADGDYYYSSAAAAADEYGAATMCRTGGFGASGAGAAPGGGCGAFKVGWKGVVMGGPAPVGTCWEEQCLGGDNVDSEVDISMHTVLCMCWGLLTDRTGAALHGYSPRCLLMYGALV
jgi:hypothetical protein